MAIFIWIHRPKAEPERKKNHQGSATKFWKDLEKIFQTPQKGEKHIICFIL